MKLLKNKKFYVSVLIDFSFLLILYGFIFLIAQKIREYAFMLQNFDLSDIEAIIQENMSMLDYNMVLGNLDVISDVMQKISFMFFILLVGSFILYCLFQGFNWNRILKIKFKKYFWKFSLVSLVSFSLSLLFLWYILFNVRGLMVNYFSNLPLFGLILKIVFLFILILVLWYYTSVCYVLLKENKIIDSLKKSFKFKNLRSVFVYFVCFILVMLILVLFLVLNLSNIYWLVVEVFLILFVVNYCKSYFVRIV